MGLPPAVEPVGEEATRGWPRAPVNMGVAGYFSAAEGGPCC